MIINELWLSIFHGWQCYPSKIPVTASISCMYNPKCFPTSPFLWKVSNPFKKSYFQFPFNVFNDSYSITITLLFIFQTSSCRSFPADRWKGEEKRANFSKAYVSKVGANKAALWMASEHLTMSYRMQYWQAVLSHYFVKWLQFFSLLLSSLLSPEAWIRVEDENELQKWHKDKSQWCHEEVVNGFTVAHLLKNWNKIWNKLSKYASEFFIFLSSTK